nr:MAG TPA: hypothetical protein [Caudoviricetes sp.]
MTYIRENSILIEQGHIETIAEALGSRPGLRQFLQGLMGEDRVLATESYHP